MTYQYHSRFVRQNEIVKRTVRPPTGFDESFIDAMQFEWNPETNELMFCWVYLKDSQEMFTLRQGLWLITKGNKDELGKQMAQTVDAMPAFDYQSSKGCGAMVEQAALFKLRQMREREQFLH